MRGGADGSGGEFENPHQVMTSPAENEYGVIYRFEPGDVIDLNVQVNGDIIRSDEPIAIGAACTETCLDPLRPQWSNGELSTAKVLDWIVQCRNWKHLP